MVVSRLRRACLPTSIIGFFNGAFQQHLDQMQDAPINNTARHRLHGVGMGDASEVVRSTVRKAQDTSIDPCICLVAGARGKGSGLPAHDTSLPRVSLPGFCRERRRASQSVVRHGTDHDLSSGLAPQRRRNPEGDNPAGSIQSSHSPMRLRCGGSPPNSCRSSCPCLASPCFV